jgi:hypothetical protein
MLFYVQYTSLKAFLSILFPKLHLFWKRKKISLLTMLFHVQNTSFKAFLSILFPKLHLFWKRKLELFLFNLNSK